MGYCKNKMNITTQLKPFQCDTIAQMTAYESRANGGLLLNEAGLGKSLCVLGVIAGSPSTTLIICPAGLVDNWINEVRKHTDLSEDQVVRFYGPKRGVGTCSDALIWITSYTTLSKDIAFLSDQRFGRIVLDEAHYIRNSHAKISKDVFQLAESNPGSKRWAVTATPIYNKSNDAYSYFKFLGHVADKAEWTQRYSTDVDLVKSVNQLMKQYGIRYKKEDVLGDELTPKNEVDLVLQFSTEEKEFYDALKEYSSSRLVRLLARVRSTMNNITMRRIAQTHVLAYILRLKQACNSPYLVIDQMPRLQGINNIEEASKRLKFYNQSKNVEEECPVCLDKTTDRIANPCGHKYCNECWKRMEEHEIFQCPVCRTFVLSVDDIRPDSNKTVCDSLIHSAVSGLCHSSKLVKLHQLVDDITSKKEKVVIVSQWVKMLDLIKLSPIFANVTHVTLQGSMRIEERTATIKQFETDPKTQVCFLSLTSSAEGINLVSANHLVLVDSWWNQSQMIQVMNRIHRIGQQKDVHIYKMQINDSIEERIKKLVTKKHNIATNILENCDEEMLCRIFQESQKLVD